MCRQSQSVSFSQDAKVRFSDVCLFGVLPFSRLAYNEIGLAEGGVLEAPNRQASTKANRMNNTSNMHFTPAFGKPMLADAASVNFIQSTNPFNYFLSIGK